MLVRPHFGIGDPEDKANTASLLRPFPRDFPLVYTPNFAPLGGEFLRIRQEKRVAVSWNELPPPNLFLGFPA